MALEQVLVAGGWRDAKAKSTFHAEDPTTGETLEGVFPISEWHDCDDALNAAVTVAGELRTGSRTFWIYLQKRLRRT